jgi:hypothetical protein
MNLKAVVAADQSPDHFRGRATSITAAAASPTVAPPERPELSDAELPMSIQLREWLPPSWPE